VSAQTARTVRGSDASGSRRSARLRAADPAIETAYRDLVTDPIPHLDLGGLPAAAPESRAVLDQFLASDIVVVGVAMYNFALPSQLKAWIDRIMVAGKTFKYSAQGPEGLAGNKRVIVALSRGGYYGPGTPAAALEHLETYLRGIFGFMGITNVEFITADGIQVGPEHREKAIAGALQSATSLRAA